MRCSLVVVTCTLALAVTVGGVRAATYTFQTIDPPGAGAFQLYPLTILSPGPFFAINDNGQILGQDSTGSFVDTNGTFTYFNFPSSTSPVFATSGYRAFPGALNNNGQIVGLSYDSRIGFLDTNGAFVKVVPPGAAQSHPYLTFFPTSINDYGQMVGSYIDFAGAGSKRPELPVGGPILNSDGSAVPFNPPIVGGTIRQLNGINNAGQIAGIYSTGDSYDTIVNQAFLYTSGVVSTISPPGAMLSRTSVSGISNTGEVVGSYLSLPSDLNSEGHIYNRGYVYDNGVYTTIDVPGALDTLALGINSAGDVVGGYYDATSTRGFHGFLATPVPVPEPASLTLLAAALAALGLAARRPSP